LNKGTWDLYLVQIEPRNLSPWFTPGLRRYYVRRFLLGEQNPVAIRDAGNSGGNRKNLTGAAETAASFIESTGPKRLF
jgi:hypothetical protein